MHIYELTEMVYNKVERNEVLEVTVMHQGLNTSEVKEEIMLEEEKAKQNPYETLLVQNLEEAVLDTGMKQIE